MATKIRLRRTGTTNLALYRIVVVDSRSPRDGRFIEILGHYDPRKEGKDKIVVDSEKVLSWLNKGAEISETVRSLLKTHGFEFPVKNRKKRKDKPEVKQTAAPASESVVNQEEVLPEEEPAAETMPEETAPDSEPVVEETEEAKTIE